MPNLQITELEREDEAAWDAYVYSSHTSTFYHQQRSALIKLFKSLMWRNVVEKMYKHKPIYLIAKEEGKIRGVLLLFLMRSLVFSKKLVSVPFAPYARIMKLLKEHLLTKQKGLQKRRVRIIWSSGICTRMDINQDWQRITTM